MDLKTNIYTNVDRAINEFRSGRPIIVKNGVENWVFFTVENLNIKILNQLTKGSEKKIFTYITNNKANNLNIKKKNYKGCFSFPFRIKDTKLLMSMHTKKLNKFEKNKFDKNYYNKCPNFINYIMNLAKNAKTIPCLIGSLIDPKLVSHSVMVFDYRNLKNQNKIITQSTKMVSKSNIPLVKNHKAIIMVFKSFVGGLEHIVLQIGKPNKQKSINLRIQSACLTGEVFHSIKCDCNEQLHQSINYISKNGGGYIIHLEQEGRGIGLANKIKAYDMQNKGMDTYLADTTLGFLEEERDFDIAVKILKLLKINKVNLITNNQEKIRSLINNNIKVQKKIPTYPTVNRFNYKYLLSKNKKRSI